jgi:hypothetical protein
MERAPSRKLGPMPTLETTGTRRKTRELRLIPPIEDPPLPPTGPTPGEPDSDPTPDSVPESPEPTPIDG